MAIGRMAFVFLALAVSVPCMADVVAYTDEAAWQSVINNRTTATFDEFTGDVTNQYSGAVFFGVGEDGENISCHTYDYVPDAAVAVSNPHVMAIREPGHGAWGASWGIDFSQPVSGVGFWYMDVENDGSSVILKDQTGGVLGTYLLTNHGDWYSVKGLSFVGLTSSLHFPERCIV